MTTVKHEIDGKVGVVTLAKPPHNLIDDVLVNDLVAAYKAVISEGCRAILLRSSQRHFCAGAEVQSFGTTTLVHTDQRKFETLMRSLEDVSLPTVAAVHGGVLGGGLELAHPGLHQLAAGQELQHRGVGGVFGLDEHGEVS